MVQCRHAVKAGRIERATEVEHRYVWMDDLEIFDEEGTEVKKKKNHGEKSWKLPLSKAFMS